MEKLTNIAGAKCHGWNGQKGDEDCTGQKETRRWFEGRHFRDRHQWTQFSLLVDGLVLNYSLKERYILWCWWASGAGRLVLGLDQARRFSVVILLDCSGYSQSYD